MLQVKYKQRLRAGLDLSHAEGMLLFRRYISLVCAAVAPLLICLFPVCLQVPVIAAQATASEQNSAQRPTSTPYSGDLSIFEYPDRDKKLQINRVMDLLAIDPGKNVADIGAGSGWFTVRAARRVGQSGTVFAEDINPKAVQYIDQRAQRENLSNIRTILGTPDNPKLPPDSVDALLMLKVYHEIAHPGIMLAALHPALRKGARIGIIDRNGNGTDHGLNHQIVEKEMAEAGYRLIASYDFTKADGQDYFLIFTPR